jgi:glycosyltransferase involved in cell wall biosynthesis
MAEKRKILFLSDHPLVPSGVGTQAKYLIEGLLETGRYKFICLGGAIKHPDMRPQKVAPEKYGDDWIIFPVEGHGDKNIVRQIIMAERPDAVFIFTDPRFFMWLWEIEDEVRAQCPIVYWHVWDNDPTPKFNKVLYESTDHVVALSMKTKGLLDDLGYERCTYIPHSVSMDNFKPLPEEEVQKFKRESFGPHVDKKFVLFWNNRNARRKQTGDVVATFAKFAERVGKQNVVLFMHTNVHDPEGQDISAVAQRFDIDNNLIISEQRVDPAKLNMVLNVADATINIASNEGFGLGTLESLASGTPIIVHMTGGLQYQIGDWWNDLKDFRNQDQLTAHAKKLYRAGKGKWWGVPVFSASRSCTGSQPIPYIYDDKVNHDEVVSGLVRLYEMGRTKRKALGLEARDWVNKNFNEKQMVADWDRVLEKEIATYKGRERQTVRQASV